MEKPAKKLLEFSTLIEGLANLLEEGMGLDRCVIESDESMYRVKRSRHEALEQHARFFGKSRRSST